MISLRRKKGEAPSEPAAVAEKGHASLVGRFRQLFRKTATTSRKPCPRCHTKNPAEVLFCKECGSRYPSDDIQESRYSVVRADTSQGTQGMGVQQKKTLFERGNAYYKSGQYQEALEMYDQAIRIDREYAKAWNNRSLVLKKMGREREALESRDRFLALQNSGQRSPSPPPRLP